jgi:hypothetical protein
MPVGRTSKTWEDNIKIDFKEFDYGAVKRAYLVFDKIIRHCNELSGRY